MRDRIIRDRQIVKLFYTACCLWDGLVLVPLMVFVHEPDKWEMPDARATATIYAFILAVLGPVWAPYFRRQYTGFPHSPLEGVRSIWAVFAPIAAMFVLWMSPAPAIALLFSSTGNDRLLAFMVALVGAALIVVLSWHVAADSDLVPPRQAHLDRPSGEHHTPPP